jgi:hypothetical protein
MNEETIFLTALEKASPTERAAYLDAACAGDAALRARVEALLRSQADPDSFLDRPAVARQAERTTDVSADPADEPAAEDEGFAFLTPGGAPGSLGRLDHYEVLEVIGRGGMGVVFKARDTRLQRVVAIKVLAAPLAASGTARQRFFREARAAAAVRDEHVVSIHAVSDDSGPTPYLVMEFIAGVTLEKRLKARGPLAVKEVLRIGMQAAEGLASAYRQGLIHRDVKPANILLENGVERVKLTDFGLARTADDASISQSGVIAGTPLYMSPEQARGETLDARSDLFSLGSVLYTLCTGRAAFAAGNTVAVLKRVCEETPRPIREVNPDMPEWLAAVVDRLLAKEPGERFQSAGELAELLGQRLAELQQSRLAPAAAPEKQAAVRPAAAPAKPASLAARKRKRLAVIAGLLGLVGIAVGLMTLMLLKQPWPGGQPEKLPLPAHDPRVLTVSQKPEDGGRFRTIQEALDEVEQGMAIRVLDDAVYDERLVITKRHDRVLLEAIKKATIRQQADHEVAVAIRGATRFTLRGFRFSCPPGKDRVHVFIKGACPGVVLDQLDMTATEKETCIVLLDAPRSDKDAPIVVQNCTLRNTEIGVDIRGREANDWDDPRPTGNVVVRSNTVLGCGAGVVLSGAVNNIHVVGNRIVGATGGAIDLCDLLPGSADILVANNSSLQCDAAVRIWDDHTKGEGFLKCKNIRVQNNLVFKTGFPGDMVFSNHKRGGNYEARSPCNLQSLLDSRDWLFSHNWREVDQASARARAPDRWIPLGPSDHALPPNAVLSLKPGNPDFLRPPKDSPLATGGAGVSDISLPAYVGAVPPEGVPEWDWQKTWDIQCRRLLTVSKDPAAGGHFRTIQEALDAVMPGMTIRVLDDAVYEDHLVINRPEKHRGVVLEAAGKAAIRRPADKSEAVLIKGVPRFTLRGFFLDSSLGPGAAIFIGGSCPGALFDRLDLTAHAKSDCFDLYNAKGAEDAPIVIQNCTVRQGGIAVDLEGRDRGNPDIPARCAHVVVRNNTLMKCNGGVRLQGQVCQIHVVGNRILDSGWHAMDLCDFLPGTADILIANNTLSRNNVALIVWDAHEKGKDFLKCKRIVFENNLLLGTTQDGDLFFQDHQRGNYASRRSGDLRALLDSREWRFGHNWRETEPIAAAARYRETWIPRRLEDHFEIPINFLSRTPGDPNFLRPPKDSPLTWSGAGGHIIPSARSAALVGQAAGLANPWMAGCVVAQPISQPDLALPAYVGAVPPEGVEPWDWDKTWNALTR